MAQEGGTGYVLGSARFQELLDLREAVHESSDEPEISEPVRAGLEGGDVDGVLPPAEGRGGRGGGNGSAHSADADGGDSWAILVLRGDDG